MLNEPRNWSVRQSGGELAAWACGSTGPPAAGVGALARVGAGVGDDIDAFLDGVAGVGAGEVADEEPADGLTAGLAFPAALVETPV
jgi:hypothetical protein